MIEINETTLGIWFVEMGDSNWMGSAWRSPGGGVEGAYRFRIYHDSKAIDSADERNFYSLKSDGSGKSTPESLVETMSDMAKYIEKQTPGAQRWELLRGTSTFNQFWDEFVKLPFVHQDTKRMKRMR